MRRQILWLLAVLLAACAGENDKPPEGKVPQVASCSVADDAMNVALDAGGITIRWSTPVEVVSEAGFVLTPAVATTVERPGITQTLVKYDALAGLTDYTLRIEAGTVRAVTGRKTNEAWSMSFTTAREVLANPDLNDPVAWNIDPAPVSGGALATALYNRLLGWWGEKTLSASMASYTVGTESDDWVFKKTGKHTAIATFDFMNVNRQEKWASWDRPYSKLIENAVAWHEAGGLVSCMWHWRDPSGASDEFYCNPAEGRPTYATFDAAAIFDPSSTGYKQMIAEVDLVAGYLKQLKDAGIAVLWRPLHEAEGNHDGWGGAWFWWGNASGDRAAACVELWRVMYDRMTNHHGLDNLIWVWTNQLTGLAAWYDECLTWYPGAEYVDVIGIDIYDANQTIGRGSHAAQFKKTALTAAGRKMVALTECGYIPATRADEPWLWWMPWNDDFTKTAAYNGDYWATVLAEERILTRDKL